MRMEIEGTGERFSRRVVVTSAAACALGAPLVAACGAAGGPSGPGGAPGATAAAGAGRLEAELVLYSARKEELMQPVVDLFQKKAGVKVTVKSGGAGELPLVIEQERASPRADVFFTTDAAGAEQLRQKALLEPYRAPNAEQIPAEFKAPDGAWTGVIGRSRNIMTNTALVRAEEAPKSVFDLTAARWKGRVAAASIAEGGVRLWLGALVVLKGAG